MIDRAALRMSGPRRRPTRRPRRPTGPGEVESSPPPGNTPPPTEAKPEAAARKVWGTAYAELRAKRYERALESYTSLLELHTATTLVQTFQKDTRAMREAIERDPEAVAMLMGASRMCRRAFAASRRLPSVLDTDERGKAANGYARGSSTGRRGSPRAVKTPRRSRP